MKAKRSCRNIAFLFFFFEILLPNMLRASLLLYEHFLFKWKTDSSVLISGYLVGTLVSYSTNLPMHTAVWVLLCLGGESISIVDGAVNENSVVPFTSLYSNCSFSCFLLPQVDIWLN